MPTAALTTEDKKVILSKLQVLKRDTENYRLELAEIRARSTSTQGIDYTRTPTGKRGNADISDFLIKCEKAESRYAKRGLKYLQFTEMMLKLFDDTFKGYENLRLVMSYRYISLKPVKEVAKELDYGERTIQRKIDQAFSMLDDDRLLEMLDFYENT